MRSALPLHWPCPELDQVLIFKVGLIFPQRLALPWNQPGLLDGAPPPPAPDFPLPPQGLRLRLDPSPPPPG